MFFDTVALALFCYLKLSILQITTVCFKLSLRFIIIQIHYFKSTNDFVFIRLATSTAKNFIVRYVPSTCIHTHICTCIRFDNYFYYVAFRFIKRSVQCFVCIFKHSIFSMTKLTKKIHLVL